MPPMHLEVDEEENVHSPNSIVDSETKKTLTEASNGGESPFGSPKHGFKRSLEWSDDFPPSKRARHFPREEGRPMREVTSVFITPSGIIQSAYEGKIAEPSLPQIIDSPPYISEPEHYPLQDNACLFSHHSEEEGRPMREVTSVFVTPSGFIYSAYEGKVAAASLPQIIDSPPSTSKPEVHTTDILHSEKEMESKDSKKERSLESINDKKSNKGDSKKCKPSKKENTELSSEKSGNTSFSAKKEDNSHKLSAKGEKNLKVGDSGKSKNRGGKGGFKKYKDSSKLYKFKRQVNKRSVMSSNSHAKDIKLPKSSKASKPEKLRSPSFPVPSPTPSPPLPPMVNKKDSVERNFPSVEVMQEPVELKMEGILAEARYRDVSPEFPSRTDDSVETQAGQKIEPRLADLDKRIDVPLPKSAPLPAPCPEISPLQPTVMNKEDGVENNFQNDEVMEQSVELNVEDILGEARYTDDSPEIPAITDDYVEAQARQEESRLADLDKHIEAPLPKSPPLPAPSPRQPTVTNKEDGVENNFQNDEVMEQSVELNVEDILGEARYTDDSPEIPAITDDSVDAEARQEESHLSDLDKCIDAVIQKAIVQYKVKSEKTYRDLEDTINEDVRGPPLFKMQEQKHIYDLTDSSNGSPPEVHNSPVVKVPVEKEKPSKTTKMTVKTTPSASVQESSKREKAEERHKKKTVMEQNEFTDSPNGSRPDSPDVRNSAVTKMPVGKKKPSKTTQMTVKTTPSASVQESSKREKAEERHKKKTVMEQNEFTDSPNGSRPDSPDVRNSAVTKMPVGKEKPSKTTKMTVKTTPSASVQDSSKREKAEERHKKKTVMEQNEFTDSPNGSRPDSPDVRNSAVTKMPVGKEKPSKTTQMTVKTTPFASVQESSKREKAEERHKKSVMEQNDLTDSSNGSRREPDVRNSPATKMPVEKEKSSKTPIMTVKTTPSAAVQENSKKEKVDDIHKKKSVMEQNDCTDSSNGSGRDSPDVRITPVTKMAVEKEKPSKTPKMIVKTTPSALVQDSSKKEKVKERHKKRTVKEQNPKTFSLPKDAKETEGLFMMSPELPKSSVPLVKQEQKVAKLLSPAVKKKGKMVPVKVATSPPVSSLLSTPSPAKESLHPIPGPPQPTAQPMLSRPSSIPPPSPSPGKGTHSKSGRGRGRPAAAQQPVPVARTVITKTVGTVILDDDGNEIWMCPTCKRLDDGSPMIGCDGCNNWHHWVCVNIVVPPKEEESWFCERCITKRKTAPVKRGRKKHKREK